MKQISKEEMEWLLTKGYLKIIKGKIEDLVVVSKRKKHGGKTRYVPEPIYEKLKERKQ